jgi:hypothetical protein
MSEPSVMMATRLILFVVCQCVCVCVCLAASILKMEVLVSSENIASASTLSYHNPD